MAGLAVAKELDPHGPPHLTARARELGIGVVQVVPAAELRGGGGAARGRARGRPDRWPSTGRAKRAIDGGFDLPMREALALERACYEVVLESEDRNEGLTAFAEKRAPRFTGK